MTRFDLEAALDELTAIGDLRLGRGPRHPTDPRLDLESEVATFLDEHPFVRRDDAYAEFLGRYAGGVFWREQDLLSLGLFGFEEDLSTHLTQGPGATIEHGFMAFCDVVIPKDPAAPFGDVIGLGFGFDATGTRRWGVYRLWGEGRHDWYCETFLQWVHHFVEMEGRVHEDGGAS